MRLNKINSFKQFKSIKTENSLPLYEGAGVTDSLANTTKFSDSLVGRGAISLIKFLKRGKDFLKLKINKNRYDAEIAMGILRAYLEYKGTGDSDSQSDGQSDGQSDSQSDGQSNGQSDGDVQKDSTQSESDSDSESKEKIYIKQTKIFLKSILEISSTIENNAVRFKDISEEGDEDHGKIMNKITYFDFKEYQKMKKIYNNNKNNKEVLKELLSTLKKGLQSAISNKDKNEINLFKKELKSYGDKYWKMVMDSLEDGKTEKPNVFKEIIKKVKTDNSSIEDLKELLKNQKIKNKYEEIEKVWKEQKKQEPNEDVKKELMKNTLDKLGILSESLLLEEVESNIQSGETNAKNAWNKIIKSYKKSNIKNYTEEIEKLLKVDLSKGKDEYKKSIKNMIMITKQVINNIRSTGVMSFDNLINEGLYDNDMPKSITLFAKVVLSFKEDMGLLGSYGNATEPLKSFINSYNKMEEILINKNEGNHYTEYEKLNEVSAVDWIKGKKNKKTYGDIELDWSYFTNKEKLDKMIKAFKDENKGNKLKKRATELVNKDSIASIQYAVQSSIYHTETPDSGKLFPGNGGGISKNETYLAKSWKQMINNVKAKYKFFVNTSELDPYQLAKDTGKDADTSGASKIENENNNIVKTLTIKDAVTKKTDNPDNVNKNKDEYIIMSDKDDNYYFYFFKICNDDIFIYPEKYKWEWNNDKKDGKFTDNKKIIDILNIDDNKVNYKLQFDRSISKEDFKSKLKKNKINKLTFNIKNKNLPINDISDIFYIGKNPKEQISKIFDKLKNVCEKK